MNFVSLSTTTDTILRKLSEQMVLEFVRLFAMTLWQRSALPFPISSRAAPHSRLSDEEKP